MTRRTHASITKQLGIDPKWVAEQLGHSLDVGPVEQRRERSLNGKGALVMKMGHVLGPGIPQIVDLIGAGDRDRTGDIQLGKLTFCH